MEDSREFDKSVLSMLEYLTADEGDSIHILCEDPDCFTREHSRGVECFGHWTNYEHKRFLSESIHAAITNAFLEKFGCNGLKDISGKDGGKS